MIQTTKLTQQETQQLSQIQEKQQSYIIDLGKIEYDITLLELQKEKIQDQIEKLTQESQNLAKELETKYGSGTINIEKGEFYKQ